MRRLAAALLPVLLLVAACGGEDDGAAEVESTTTAPESATPEADIEEPATTTTTTTEPGAVEPPDGAGEDEGLGDPLVLVADLTGQAEVPGPGDAGGAGRFELESAGGTTVCIDMVVTGLAAEVTDAHIHEDAAGASGGVVVPIGVPTSSAEGEDRWDDVCIEVDLAVLDRLATDPSGFYANVHSATFGAGAVRGQLALASIFDRTL